MARPRKGEEKAGRDGILNAAAMLFCNNGYRGTSMRDIAKAVDMKTGSLYYHFPSKEELLFSVEEEAFRRVTDRVVEALNGVTDPWEKLYRASVAHLKAILENREYINVTTEELPRSRSKKLQKRFVKLRDDYEKHFRDIIDELPLADHVDPRMLRLSLLGALAWSLVWYDSKGDTPEQIAQSMIELLRYQSDGA